MNKVIKQRKKLARIDTKILQEFGKMIKPKQCKLLKRRKVKKVKQSLLTLNSKEPLKTYKQLDNLIDKLEALIDIGLEIKTETIIARCHGIAFSLYDDIRATLAYEVCKENKILSPCVDVGNFLEKGFSFDTRDLVNYNKNKEGIYQ